LNIVGLSLGICSCIVLNLIAIHDFNFDAFHSGKKRIYRIIGDVAESTGEKLRFIKLPVRLPQDARTGIPDQEFIAGKY
jgi:hypothetical protein